jgi:hypothetical protein
LIFDKGTKNKHCRKDILFNKWYWENWFSIYKRTKSDPYFSLCIKITPDESKTLMVTPMILKLLQEDIGKTLGDIGIGNYFLSRTPIAQEIRTRIDKRESIKLKSFCT